MYGIKRITANLPRELLDDACRVTGRGTTETLTEGLLLIKRSGAAVKAARLCGHLHLQIDVESSRERARH